MVVIGDVGEGRLVGAVACGLVDAPDELLEGLEDVLAYRALLQADARCGHVVEVLVPLLAELGDDVVVQHDEVLAEGYGAFALGREQEGEVRDLPRERLQVVWRAGCDAVDVAHAVGHQGVEADGHAVLFEHGGGSLVVCIYNMVVEVCFVLLRHFGVHLVQLVLHSLPLDDAVGGLVHLALQVGHVLHRYVSVGVRFRGCGGVVVAVAVLVHIVDALLDEACFGVLLAIEDVRLGLVVVAVLHQGKLHAVLYLFHGEAVAHGDAFTQVGCHTLGLLFVHLVYRL